MKKLFSKKTLSLMLVLLMLVSLVACGNTNEPVDDTSAPAQETPAVDTPKDTEAVDEEPITLTIWCDGTQLEPYTYIGEMYNKYTGKNINFEFVEMGQADRNTKIAAAAESGYYDDMADLTVIQNNTFVGLTYNYADMFLPLDDYFNPEDFSQALLDFSTYQGVHYGIPSDTGYSISLYRSDLLEAGGLTADDLNNISWAEFIEIGEKFYNDTGVYLMTSSGNTIINQMWKASGLTLFDEDGYALIDENKEDLAEIINIYKEAVDRHVIYETGGTTDSVAVVNSGIAAGISSGLWCKGSVSGTCTDYAGGWQIANVPSNKEGGPNYSVNGGSSWAVFSCSEHAEEAAEFVAYMYAGPGMTEDNYAFMDYMANVRGEFLVYMPAVNSGFYETYVDPYFGDGFWDEVVVNFDKIPSVGMSPLYTDLNAGTGLQAVAQRVIIDGVDVYEALADFQAELDFTMDS